MTTKKPANIDEYIADFPEETQKILKKIRTIIKTTTPEAEESLAYGMPAYKTDGKPLVYFAGYKNHVGLYGVSASPEFKADFAAYKTSGKGTIQFPIDKPLPVTLIKRIVKHRIKLITPDY